MAVEIVIMAPLLLIIMTFVVYAGRVIEAHSQVDQAARDAVRAASLARSQQDAQAFADTAVSKDEPGCRQPVLGQWAGGKQVTVTLTCPLNLKTLGLGFGSMNLRGYAVAPLDPFVARNG